METVFLRHRCGTPIGPLTHWTLEVLWDALIINEDTPVSLDGATFVPIAQQQVLLEHLRTVVQRLNHGADPWPENIPVRAPTSGTASSFTQRRPYRSTLSVLLHHALKRSNGVLELQRVEEGTIRLSYRDGKIVAVDVEDESLSLIQWLVKQKLVPTSQAEKAEEVANSMESDIGSAIVSSGILSPHVYFEKVIVWSLITLGRCMLIEFTNAHFASLAIDPPSVPLGFDRFGSLLQAVREATERGQLEAHFSRQKHHLLVASPMEGFTMEDAKPKPRELRILRAIDGKLTLSNLIDRFGGNEERNRDVLRTIFFAFESGLVIFGADAQLATEEAAAKALVQEWADLQQKDLFALFGVRTLATDEEVLDSYTALAKRFHPDTVREHGAESLRTIKKKLFGYLRESYQEFDTATKRAAYLREHKHDPTRTTHRYRIDMDTFTPVESRLKKADHLASVGQYGEALEHIHKGLMVSAESHELELSRIYLEYLESRQHNHSEPTIGDTIRMIREIMETHGDVARGCSYLGQLYQVAKKTTHALHFYRKALALNPHLTSVQSEINYLEQTQQDP